MAMLRFFLPFTLLPALASCVGPTPPPITMPAQTPVTAPRPTPAAATSVIGDHYVGDWSVADVSPGDWRYAATAHSTIARFTSSTGDGVAIACEDRQLILARSGQSRDGAMATLKTSFGERRLQTVTGQSGSQPVLTVTLTARDPLWDQISYSRGRFLLEVTGLRPLIVPVTSEVNRVVEDCRN